MPILELQIKDSAGEWPTKVLVDMNDVDFFRAWEYVTEEDLVISAAIEDYGSAFKVNIRLDRPYCECVASASITAKRKGAIVPYAVSEATRSVFVIAEALLKAEKAELDARRKAEKSK